MNTLNHEFRDEGWLDVGQGHRLHWVCDGAPTAPAVVILHGGPGASIPFRWGEFFDPSHWRRVFFDQRGCGQSTPFGSTDHNTLDHLVEDMDHLRQHLGLDRWALFGGSWGTTLALAYGAAHPEHCSGFLLRGMFLARQDDIDWFLWDVRKFFPDVHRRFLDAIESIVGQRPHDAKSLLTLTRAPLERSDADAERLGVAWCDYEMAMSGFIDGFPPSEPREALNLARIERHYMDDVLPPATPLLDTLPRINHLPAYIVNGRVDVLTLPEAADAVAQAWPGADLDLVDGAGHWTFSPRNAAALHRAAQSLRQDIERRTLTPDAATMPAPPSGRRPR